jgi:hypothetical protein
MAIYIYDINNIIKTDTTLKTLAGDVTTNVVMYPTVGYEDTEPPFILYWFFPGIMEKELYFVRVDQIQYTIYDTDSDRCYNMGQRVIDIMNKGDSIAGTIPSSIGRALWSFLIRARQDSPIQREGFYAYELLFEVGYVPL